MFSYQAHHTITKLLQINGFIEYESEKSLQHQKE